MWMCGRAKGLNINLTRCSTTPPRELHPIMKNDQKHRFVSLNRPDTWFPVTKILKNKIYILTKLAFIHNNGKREPHQGLRPTDGGKS